MDNPLDPETEQRIRALCDEIAVAHDLDVDLREELRGHVEDKVLGYLSGEEAVSEADAFILAREHFGDRTRLKAMLSDVHHVEFSESLWRRIAGGYVMVMCLTSAIGVVGAMAYWLIDGYVDASFLRYSLVHVVVGTVEFLALLGLLCYVLVREKKRITRGDNPWFMRWRPWALAISILATLALQPLSSLASAALSIRREASPLELDAGALLNTVLAVSATLGVVTFILGFATLWMWWCDGRTRGRGDLRQAALALMLMVGINSFLGNQFRLVPESRYSDATVLLTRGHHQWVWMPLNGVQMAYSLGIAAIIAVLGLVAYEVGIRVRRRFGDSVGLAE